METNFTSNNLLPIQNYLQINKTDYKPSFKGITYPNLTLKKDTVSFSSNNSCSFINEDNSLFEGVQKKPIEKIEDIAPNNLVLVHMTDYFPENAQILSAKNALKDNNGASPNRSTVHFALNHVVNEHIAGYDWHSMKYGIILPYDAAIKNLNKKNILGGKINDFFVRGNVQLPDNSIIVKHNPDIEKGKLKITDASKTLKDFKNTKGIKIVETSNPDMQKAVSTVIEKTGYSRLDSLMNKERGYSEEAADLMTSDKKQKKLKLENPQKFYEITGNIDWSKVSEYEKHVNECWNNFCRENNLTDCWHTYSPWGRSESLIECINVAGLGTDSWISEPLYDKENENFFDEDGMPKFPKIDEENLSEEEKNEILSKFLSSIMYSDVKEEINYKTEFLKVIDEIKQQTPKDKPLSYDIDKMKKIIEKSEKPSIALKQIESELGLKLMPNEKMKKEIPNAKEKYAVIDTLLCLSEIQKNSIYETGIGLNV